ncbi:unnamed protein product [Adineta steineri]|uniref:Uncharacterized protein n=1 Tax=Adineta steineri TaxID=433720 RepID=A0A814WTQ5_9BILA|nr:unnamed protein product [Adineta steineri]
MHTNQVYTDLVTVNNEPHKWWHRRWVKIISISVTVLIVFAVVIALVLNFVVFAPKKSQTGATAPTSSSSLTTTISTPPSLSTTTPLVTSTTTLPQTTTTTTTQQSEWSATGNMNNTRRFHTASVLSNGKVLVTGGFNGYIALNSTELYDPLIGTWATTSNMNDGRVYHRASVLSNGKVLVTGGSNYYVGFLNSAELY